MLLQLVQTREPKCHLFFLLRISLLQAPPNAIFRLYNLDQIQSQNLYFWKIRLYIDHFLISSAIISI